MGINPVCLLLFSFEGLFYSPLPFTVLRVGKGFLIFTVTVGPQKAHTKKPECQNSSLAKREITLSSVLCLLISVWAYSSAG